MRKTIILCLSILALVGFGWTSAFAQAEKPNIVFIMADDLGNADLGYRGSDIKTPNIDKLAERWCAPRVLLRHARLHAVAGGSDDRALPHALRPADAGHLPQPHLRPADRRTDAAPGAEGSRLPDTDGRQVASRPCRQEVLAAESRVRPLLRQPRGRGGLLHPERGGVIDWQRNGKFLKEEGYYTTLIGNEAVKLIEEQDGKKPFFLYFASLAPHAPYQAPQEYVDRYATIKDKQRRTYAAMITCLDDQVGRIVAALEKKNLRENTLIIFASDNGGATSALFASGAKRKEERESEVGGIEQGAKPRPPTAISAAARAACTKAASACRLSSTGRLSSSRASSTNRCTWWTSCPRCSRWPAARAARTTPLTARTSGRPLAEGKPSPHEDILINVEAFRGAVRKGNWKLVKIALLPGKTELFDLSADPGEKNNVAEQHPEIVRDLESRLMAYAKEQKPSEWIKAQPAFVGEQGKTVFDPDFDIDDGGLPREKPVLPKK